MQTSTIIFPAHGLKAWRDIAQAQLPEPVINACRFSRPSQASGDLPEQFILAVTRFEIIAFDLAGAEITRWQRSDLRVSWVTRGDELKVTLGSFHSDEDIQCFVAKTHLHEWFLTLMTVTP